MNIEPLFKHFGHILKENSPAILSAVAVGGVATVAILAVKATGPAIDAVKLYDSLQAIKQDRPVRDKLETVKIAWRFYIPTALVGVSTIACVLGANTISTRRQAAMLGAYSLSEITLKEYREKVVETLGVSKEQDVHASIAQDRMNNNPPSDSEIWVTGSGDALCYDSYSGRYFTSSMEKIHKAENEINFMVLNDGYASQNDFNALVGLPMTDGAEDVGYRLGHKLELKFSGTLTPADKPCMAMNYKDLPSPDYWKIPR